MHGSLALHGTDFHSPPPSNLTLPCLPNKRMKELIWLLVQARTARLGHARGAESHLTKILERVGKEFKYPCRCILTSHSFGRLLRPVHLQCKSAQSVSYYALFQGWLLLGKPAGCLCIPTSFIIERSFRGLSCRDDSEIDFLFEVQEEGEEPLSNGAFTKVLVHRSLREPLDSRQAIKKRHQPRSGDPKGPNINHPLRKG
ncbi:hypothetical protein HAX54_043425 [Datura stramonium]|uniref:Uncharacterized protein n=1 Tax=Datura stramonium TaxID=4076 RepID=A0ABS8SN67_DATST|nr:hypothetical protein [Datura stramonium]